MSTMVSRAAGRLGRRGFLGLAPRPACSPCSGSPRAWRRPRRSSRSRRSSRRRSRSPGSTRSTRRCSRRRRISASSTNGRRACPRPTMAGCSASSPATATSSSWAMPSPPRTPPAASPRNSPRRRLRLRLGAGAGRTELQRLRQLDPRAGVSLRPDRRQDDQVERGRLGRGDGHSRGRPPGQRLLRRRQGGQQGRQVQGDLHRLVLRSAQGQGSGARPDRRRRRRASTPSASASSRRPRTRARSPSPTCPTSRASRPTR